MQSELRIFCAREEQYVFDHPAHAIAFFDARCQHGLVVGGGSVARHCDFGCAAHVGNRRAQVMRQIRGELPKPIESELQTSQHAVERFGEIMQFQRHSPDIDA